MDAVRFGPLVVPVQVALLLAGITLAHSVAAWFRTRRGVDPGPVLWKMIVFGFLAGRSIFVLRHHEILVRPRFCRQLQRSSWVSFLESHGRQAAIVPVAALSVVEHLDVVEHV